MKSIEEAKRLVIKAGLRLVESGLIARTWGNVSHRIDGDQFVITPSGREYHSLTPGDIVTVRIADGSYEGKIKPSSEKGIHADVYKQFPDAQFVIHTHQVNASVVSACGLDAIRVDPGVPGLAGEVLCADYALSSTNKLRRHVAAAFSRSKGKAVIMKYHGVLCYGKDDEEAFAVALDLEKACEDYIAARYLKLSGKDRIDDPAEMSRYAIAAGEERRYSMTEDEEARIRRAVLERYPNRKELLWNRSPEIIAYSRAGRPMKPLLDDFAQMVGTSAAVVENNPEAIAAALKRSSAVIVRDQGALCVGSTREDALAASIIIEKNAKAYVGAKLFGSVKPIAYWESLLMRIVYLKKYSKQAFKNSY